MRADALGMFWVKELPKKPEPPQRFWESPDYLPCFQEARDYVIPVFTDAELVQAAFNDEILTFDTECYVNYWLCMFQSQTSGKIVYFEMKEGGTFNCDKLRWVLENFQTVSFNGIRYDIPIITLALNYCDCQELKAATNEIIDDKVQPYRLLRNRKVEALQGLDHIDLKEVAPGRYSLKHYAGRMGAPRLQDLPFRPDMVLSDDQITILRWYCINDLANTTLLYRELKDQIDLRTILSKELQIDVRSKSDPQIAEVAIKKELEKLGHRYIAPPIIEAGTHYKFNIPDSVVFKTEIMNRALATIAQADFFVNDHGKIKSPPSIKALDIELGGVPYQMGMGGLHSKESNVTHFSTDEIIILDIDVDGFYPKIVINQELYPEHLGRDYLKIYGRYYVRRIDAKAIYKLLSKIADKTTADLLKIFLNGAFGKHGNMFSILFAPMNLIQITLSGQLYLLMLIERFALASVKVISANTDGIVFECPVKRHDEIQGMIKQWESDTNFTMSQTKYNALYQRDVNAYIGLKENGGRYKGKSVFANPWAEKDHVELLKHNPANIVCIEAVVAYFEKQIPIEKTIRACKDVKKFVTVRKVEGGAVKDNDYLGEIVRWYYANNTSGDIVYAKTGNKVARSDTAKPLMALSGFPKDINYQWYIDEAYSFIKGFSI